MKLLAGTLLFLSAVTVVANGATPFPFTFYVHDTTGQLPDTPLPANYQLASTAVGGGSPLVLKMLNSSANTAQFVVAVVSNSAPGTDKNANFSVTGQFVSLVLPPGASSLFTVNFTPVSTGTITGYFNVAYQVQTGNCSFTSTDPATACPNGLQNVSTLVGTAVSPQLVLSYQTVSGPVTLTPSSSSPLNFPNTSLSASSTLTFTLTNQNSIQVTVPSITLKTNLNASSAFALDTSNVPVALASGVAANFQIVFAPSQLGLAGATLQIGANSYPMQGVGIVLADIDSLQISYTDSTGVRALPQSATPISFGQVTSGTGASSVLTFSLANPATSLNSIVVPNVTVSGSGFSLSGVPAAPITVAPGNAVTFKALFTPPTSGTFSGGLAIGTRTFSLTGVSVVSSLPAFTLQLGGPIASQQQATVSILFNSPSPVGSTGTIGLQFKPSVANVTDDPAVVFLATNSRILSVLLNSGSQTASYNNQTNLPFQTGTTAGVITFTVTFPNTVPYTQSFTITPAAPQITSISATRSNPNLIVTFHGYDNTYSAGQVTFTFYDLKGVAVGSPIQVNAAANFQQLFFNNNQAGGTFSLQASFPVTGDVTQIGSVAVGLTNSVGQANSTATFQ